MDVRAGPERRLSTEELTFRIVVLKKTLERPLDSMLKSRDITLPTKVHIVKAVVFPIVMYRCETGP